MSRSLLIPALFVVALTQSKSIHRLGLENIKYYPFYWNIDESVDALIDPNEFRIYDRNYTQVGNACSNQPDGCQSWTQGYWPTISPNYETIINGGVPQNGNLTLHLETIKNTLPQWIPDANWSGNAVLDFEDWTTVWEYNNVATGTWHSQRYQNYSIMLIKEQNPNLMNQTEIINLAKNAFEKAAINWFVETLKICKKIRPFAKWGFYGLPKNLDSPCVIINNNTELCGYDDPNDGNIYKGYSDIQIPIWKQSDVIYPSIYIPNNEMTDLAVAAYINNTVKEALRCAINGGDNEYSRKLVYPYMWMRYHNGVDLLSDTCLNMSVKLPYDNGADGIVIWGGTENKNSTFWGYFTNFSGPVIDNTISNIQLCGTNNCNQHGRCLVTGNGNEKQNTCQCDVGWSGQHCDQFGA